MEGVAYPIWVGMSYLCLGGHFSMFPTVGARVFGIKYGGQIFTLIFMAIPIASTLSFIMVQYVKEGNAPEYICWVGCILTLLNMFLLWKFDDSPIIRKKSMS